MVLCSVSNLSSVTRWVRDHRVHHTYSGALSDPHSAARGFWFSHMGWLLLKRDPRVIFAAEKTDMRDVLELPEIRTQRAFYPFWNFFWCLMFPALVCVCGWDEDAKVALYVAGLARYIVQLHFVFCVNSVAHLGQNHPYKDMLASEQPVVSWVTLGEGWHCWHHLYPYDYAASEFGASTQFNPTKIVIDMAAKLGLVWGRRRALDHWQGWKERRLDSVGKRTKQEMRYVLTGMPLCRKRKIVAVGKKS